MGIGRDQGRENGEKQEEQEPVSRFKKAKEKEINAEARKGKSPLETKRVCLPAHRQIHTLLLL